MNAKSSPASVAGRIGAHAKWARTSDTRAATAPARAAAQTALNRRLLAEIDPENTLSEAERIRRLEHARRAHFTRLAMKSAAARRRRGAG